MIYLVLTEFIPEALDLGKGLPRGGKPQLAGGIVLGILLMVPLAFI
jgi:ZIP family zinc transporter